MLYLRYRCSQPVKDPKPKPLMPMSKVAMKLKEKVESVRWLERKYFSNKKTVITQDGSRVTLDNISAEEIKFLVG